MTDETQEVRMNFPLVIESDMQEEQRVDAVEAVVTVLEKYANDMEQAALHIKEAMDKVFGSGHQVIVGPSYSYCIDSQIGHKLVLAYGLTGVLCFKACD